VDTHLLENTESLQESHPRLDVFFHGLLNHAVIDVIAQAKQLGIVIYG